MIADVRGCWAKYPGRMGHRRNSSARIEDWIIRGISKRVCDEGPQFIANGIRGIGQLMQLVKLRRRCVVAWDNEIGFRCRNGIAKAT